jgi:hypothetical protein
MTADRDADPDAAPEPGSDVPPRTPPRIDATFRNGSMTVVGVLAAFSLGILMQVTDDPAPWHATELIVVVPMATGIAAQLVALKRLLHPTALEMPRYLRAIRLFLSGLALLATGVVLGVVQDAITTM